MLLKRAAVLALVAVALASCGGGSPAGPTPKATSPPATATPSVTAAVVDGITGASLDSRTGPAGSAVSVTRDGYLRRDTLLPASGPVTLWPVTVSEDYVRTLVYEWMGTLIRWRTPVITVAADYPAEGVGEVNALGFVTVVPTAVAPAVTWAIDPSDPTIAAGALGVTSLRVQGRTIVGARVVFRDQAIAVSRTPTHELGHVLGLGHSPRNQDLMATGQRLYQRATYFSPDERVLLAMMYAHRRAGQVAPDNDQALGTAARTEREIVIVD